jgi:acyl-CoA thioester hydrolase
MTSHPLTGHDGPYPAPVETPARTVQPGWIDYNGHMNVGYYSIAFDEALDVVLADHLGIGAEHVAQSKQGPYVIQAHLHYLREMKLGQEFAVRFRLLDHDAKRLHFHAEMVLGGETAALQEIIVVNVDHASGRSAPYPDWAVARFAQMKSDHAALPAAQRQGAPIGLRKR